MLLAALLACNPPGPAGQADPTDPSTVVWSGDVVLEADHTVPSGTTLRIEPGTTVALGPDVALVVQGELLAAGTSDAPIAFTGDRAAPWRSIVFEDSAVDAVFEGVDVYASGSILEHATFEHATRALELASASPYVHTSTFRANEIPMVLETIGGAALLIRDGAVPRVRDNAFEGNLANTFAFGGAIYVHHADPILQDNTFTDNFSSYGGALATDWMAAPIVGNHFEGNGTQSEGGALSLVSTVSAVVNNTAIGNTAESDGGGFHICVTCNPHAAPYLFDNVVTGNVTAAADAHDGAGGVGAAFLGAFEGNDVAGNLRGTEPSEFGWFHPLDEAWPAWVASPTLANNWWGTTDPATLAEIVFDGADDPDALGAVTLDPVAAGPVARPTPRAVIASRRMHYEDAGDDVPVFLTVYNPGPPIAASLRITRQGVDFAGELGYPGAVRDGDVWSLELPENSVWFGTIDLTTYDGASVDDITWEAALFDPTGAPLGVPTLARYLYGPPGVQ